MIADIRLVNDLKLAEGCRLVAYRDSRGLWTIGYGHLLDQSIDWSGHEITQTVADDLLEQDLESAITQAAHLFEYRCLNTDCRRNALIEIIFNMGLNHWYGFKQCRHAIMQDDWQAAHDQLLDSAWATQVGPARSQRLANYLLTGTYP